MFIFLGVPGEWYGQLALGGGLCRAVGSRFWRSVGKRGLFGANGGLLGANGRYSP